MFSLLTLISVSLAAEPTFQRTPESPLLPFEEITMTDALIPNGCGYGNWCTGFYNGNRNWMAVEISNHGTSHFNTNRVFVDGPMVIGVYVNSLPRLAGMTTVVLNNQTVTVPVIVGEFVAAMPPCRDIHNIPHGHMKVDDTKSMTVTTEELYFDGNDRDLTVAWDAAKQILVNVPLGGYAHIGAIKSETWKMWSENGSPIPGQQPWGGIQIGNHTCRS